MGLNTISTSGRQQSQLCGQNPCGTFVGAVLATEVIESTQAMAAKGKTKVIVCISTTKVSFSTKITCLDHCA